MLTPLTSYRAAPQVLFCSHRHFAWLRISPYLPRCGFWFVGCFLFCFLFVFCFFVCMCVCFFFFLGGGGGTNHVVPWSRKLSLELLYVAQLGKCLARVCAARYCVAASGHEDKLCCCPHSLAECHSTAAAVSWRQGSFTVVKQQRWHKKERQTGGRRKQRKKRKGQQQKKKTRKARRKNRIECKIYGGNWGGGYGGEVSGEGGGGQ